nr:receptor-like protein kinase THESEUS 1 [Tanacetum cinerariifolium]
MNYLSAPSGFIYPPAQQLSPSVVSPAQPTLPMGQIHAQSEHTGHTQETTLPHAFSTVALRDLAIGAWNMDSGASSHLNASITSLSDVFNTCIYPSVSVGDGHSIPVINTGHSILPTFFRPLHLNNVLIAPHIVKNLIFVRDNNCTIEFDAFGFSVKDFMTRRLGKHVRLPFVSSSTVISSCFGIIHSDVWTSPVPSLSVNPIPNSVHLMVTRFRVGINRPTERLNLHVSSVSPLPKSYRDVFNDLNWKNAMRDEYDALIKNRTWTLVPRPADTNIVRCMWLFRHKYLVGGTLSRYKARLVANGSTQFEGVDVDKTLSPVVKLVYMHQPHGFWDSVHPDYINASLHQEFSMTDLRAHMATCNPYRTPVDTECKLGYDGDPVSDSTLYRSLAGSLQYLAFTRPNISYAVQQNISYLHQIYIPDSTQSPQDSYTIKSSSAVPFPIHQSARVFPATFTYKFHIQKQGRHFIRLHFYPVPGHNLTSASFTVVTENFVLLNSHSFDKESNFVTKEYSINVNSDTLLLNFVPSNNSFAFVNGIEVVSVPDDLIPDQAITLSHSTSLNGLSELAFETVYRLNMGGPRLTPQNDTLGRIWENDEKYLHVNSSAANVSVSPSSVMYPQSLSHEIAPSFVYATAQTMGNANVANLYFNVTWVLPVDPAFAYFVRVHFCDIVSESLNELLFNLYINSDNAYVGLDLSSLTGYLDVPVYKDFVTNSTDELSTLTVSIGPQADAVDANAILNGLEIFKISNRARSLDGVSAVDDLVVAPVKKSKKFGIVIGVVIGVVVAVILSGFCYFCVVGRGSKKVDHLNPLYGNSITMTKMSNTASCISLASCNDLGRSFSFQEILEATNKFDESLLLGVGGFGRVYRGTM